MGEGVVMIVTALKGGGALVQDFLYLIGAGVQEIANYKKYKTVNFYK